MADLVFLATMVAFFVLCVGYVRLCQRIIDKGALVAVDDHLGDDDSTSPESSAAEQAA